VLGNKIALRLCSTVKIAKSRSNWRQSSNSYNENLDLVDHGPCMDRVSSDDKNNLNFLNKNRFLIYIVNT